MVVVKESLGFCVQVVGLLDEAEKSQNVRKDLVTNTTNQG